MMGSIMREEIMDLDLNQEPLEPPHGSMLGLGSLLNDIETAHGRIEERIRQLEAVTSRARQRQRWRQGQTPSQTTNGQVVGPVAADSHSEGSIDSRERTVENSKSCKRDSSHLVAKALGMETDVKKAGSDGGGFFDCHICLDTARDPILTCCGHLFCWPCFYQLPYFQSDAKECPVCKGEVTDMNITPIYGSGSKIHKSEVEESGLKVPPRPHAHRIDSVRQQRVNQGLPSFSIEEAIRRITNRVGAVGERTRPQDLDGARITSERTNFIGSRVPTSQVLPGSEAEGSRRLRVLQFSRLLSQEAASLSSLSSTLSSALSSAERIVEDLEALFHSHPLRRNRAPALPVDDRDSFTSVAAVIHSESQTMDTAAEINSTMPLSSASSRRRTDVSSTILQMENEIMDTAIEINLTVPHSSSSSRRRTDVSYVSDVDNGVSREPRRRRLR